MEKLELNNYQSYTLNKLFKHDNSFLIWPRQAGKTTLVSYYIEWYVKNNYNKDIIFVVNGSRDKIRFSNNKIVSDLYKSNVITKIYNEILVFINNNILKFLIIDNINCHPSSCLFDDYLVIYDDYDIYHPEKLKELVSYMNRSNRYSKYNKIETHKSIFTSTGITKDTLEMIDFKNNYYINFNTKYSIYKELSYKPKELIDFNDISFQRKIKLEILNKISNEI